MAKKKKISSSDKDIKVTNANYNDFMDIMEGIFQKDYSSLVRPTFDEGIYCPTGNSAIDFILSNRLTGGGWPMGKIVELYGNNQTGKSLLGMLALISCQKGFIQDEKGKNIPGVGILIDTEQSYNKFFFEQLGGDPTKLFFISRHVKKGKGSKDEPLTVESCYEIITNTIQRIREKSPTVPIVIVWDSLAATPTLHELDKGLHAIDYGKRAQRHGVGMRKIPELLKDSNALLIIVNQLRATMAKYGPDQDSVGGNAIKYQSSLRIHLKKGKRIYEIDGGFKINPTTVNRKQLAGVQCVMQIEKTRFTAPFREIIFELFFRGGLDPFSGSYSAFTDWARDTGGAFEEAIVTSGDNVGKISKGYHMYNPHDGSESIRFGKSSFPQLLKDHPELHGPYDTERSFLLPDEENLEIGDAEQDDSDEFSVEGKPILPPANDEDED